MTTGLNVGVNLLWCRPGRVGGAEEYLTRQLKGLAVAAPDVTGHLIVPPGFGDTHKELIRSFEILEGPPWTTHLVGRLIEEMRWLPRQLANLSLVHHGLGTVPLRSPRPVVLTIHDLQYQRMPRYFSLARLNYLRFVVPRSVHRASVIAVPSQFVRQSVINAFAVDPARVVVVPHGVDLGTAPVAVEEHHLRSKFGLGPRRVFVYPAVTYPHKQHRFLIELFAGPLARPDVVLVLLGGSGRADHSVSEAITNLGVGDRVVRPGRVSDADRDGLISIAEALLFPSEYEGFGAPVIEAMALGTPVICSDRAALPEVAGDAAIILPLDLEAWAASIHDLRDARHALIARGRLRAASFSTVASGTALSRAYRLATSIAGSD